MTSDRTAAEPLVPLAIAVAVPGRAPGAEDGAPAGWTLTERRGEARTVGAVVVAAFLLGSCAAAAGILLEGDGYGGLAVGGGVVIFAVSAWPLWLVLRRPRPAS